MRKGFEKSTLGRTNVSFHEEIISEEDEAPIRTQHFSILIYCLDIKIENKTSRVKGSNESIFLWKKPRQFYTLKINEVSMEMP